eukprot:TRINITY_DN1034_c0_g1_i1.p1 TRINITY_DN1034_c0_g1~~TRINITY_DN1034_c0_g1_i1.p1  ORF type:complete len:203 (-),score=50.52 TRINITY_DN1034_c0_g1_i1:56-604(-)
MSKDTKVDDDFEAFFTPENTTSFEQQALYFANAVIVALIPVYLFYSVFYLEFEPLNAIFYIAGVGASVYAVARSYAEAAFHKKARLLSDRENVITLKSVGNLDGQKVSKRAVVAAKRQQQLSVTAHESVAFSIIFNNVLYLGAITILAGWLFKSWTPLVNYIGSTAAASALLLFSSKSAGKY